MYKLIVADLDGTLIHNKEISKKTKNTIRAIQKAGIHFAVATGRHVDSARSIYEELNCKGPLICSNGAIIYDPEKNEIIEKTIMEDDSAILIMDICDRLHSDFLVYTTEEILATTGGKQKLLDKIAKKTTIKITDKPIEELKASVNDNILKVLIIEYDEELAKRVYNQIKTLNDVGVVSSQRGFIDCGHSISSKGIAVEKLAHYYGLEMSEVVTFGDEENDISMIKSAGLGIAMGNAKPSVKFEADFITSDVRDDGFSFGIEMFVDLGDDK